MIQRCAGLMAAAVLLATAAIGLSVPFSPAAQAAYCASSGVGVVVDFGALGGGVDTGCGSGSDAATAFKSAGVTLANDPNNPGFVCRVQNMPAPGSDCMATDAYWGLFISRQGGAWAYASQGVYTQPVRAGDTVAFVWQSSNTRKQPGTAPQPLRTTAPSTAPSAKATPAPTKSGAKSTKTTKPATKAAPAPSRRPTPRGENPSCGRGSSQPGSTCSTPSTGCKRPSGGSRPFRMYRTAEGLIVSGGTAASRRAARTRSAR